MDRDPQRNQLLTDRPLHSTIESIWGHANQPDPTNPIPFERFAHLYNSNDMLQRATFWAFYFAWENENKKNGAPEKGPLPMTIEARADAHKLHAISRELAIRDALMVDRNYILWIEKEHAQLVNRVHGFTGTLWAVFLFGMGLASVVWGIYAFIH